MLANLITALAAAWAAIAVDLIAESVATDGPAIRVFGRTVAQPTEVVGTMVLVLAGASVGAIVAAGVFALIENRKANSFGVEIEKRAEERSLADAGLSAKKDLLTWRISEMQQQTDELIAKRDRLLEEIAHQTAKLQQIRTEARLSKEAIAKTTEPVVMPELRPSSPDPSALD
jgi:hypothetical protein